MDTERIKTILLAEKKKLEGELSTFAKPDPAMKGDWDTVVPPSGSGGGSANFSSSAQEELADVREEFESEVAQEQSLESRLVEVNRALERIADGSYGTCKTCGKPIAPERLEANPAAEYDIEHQPKE
jgi:RNA polymerase-binding transcription factor DksA